MLFKKLRWAGVVILIVGTTGLISCGEDEPTQSTDYSERAQQICHEGRCINDEGRKTQCMANYDACAAGGGNDDECVVQALLFCQT